MMGARVVKVIAGPAAGFALAVLLGVSIAGCGVNDDLGAVQDKPTPVRTQRVAEKEVAIPVRATGTLASKTELRLSFKTGGIVEKITVDEGRRVREGQLLAQLDLSEIEARLIQARAGLEKAERDLARVEKLYNKEVASLAELQNSRTARDIASSQAAVAEFNVKHSSIFAPADGTILKRFVEEGELLGGGTPVFMFASGERDWVIRVGIPDRDIIRLQLGDPATVSFDAYPGRMYSAWVSEVAESVNPVSGTYEVELKIEPGEGRLISGFIGKATIIPRRKTEYVVIPVEALVDGDGLDGYVFRLDEGRNRTKKTRIRIGHIFDEEIAVSSGLKTGEEIVIRGAEYLADGMPVTVSGD
jgi:RND family efflux transporter MFP subunit